MVIKKRNVIRLKNLLESQSSPEPASSPTESNSDHNVSDPAIKEPPNTTPPPPNYDDILKTLQEKAEIEVNQLRETQLSTLTAEVEAKHQEGYDAGYQKGYDEAEQQFNQMAQELTETINSAAADKETLLRNAGKDVLDLGFAIAEKVIQTKLKQDEKIFQNILEEALSKVTQKDRVLIKVSEPDFQSIQTYQDHLHKVFKDIKQLDIVPDTTIAQGGCIIETNLGYVDSSISTKLSIIERELTRLYDDTQHVHEPPSPDSDDASLEHSSIIDELPHPDTDDYAPATHDTINAFSESTDEPIDDHGSLDHDLDELDYDKDATDSDMPMDNYDEFDDTTSPVDDLDSPDHDEDIIDDNDENDDDDDYGPDDTEDPDYKIESDSKLSDDTIEDFDESIDGLASFDDLDFDDLGDIDSIYSDEQEDE